MTRYFMRDTPLRQMEQQMMTPPHFRPRGHGLYHSGFRYKPKDVECPYCTEYDRKHPCPLNQCISHDELLDMAEREHGIQEETEELTWNTINPCGGDSAYCCPW